MSQQLQQHLSPRFAPSFEKMSTTYFKSETGIRVETALSKADLAFLKRLPSTKARHIDVDKVNAENEVVVLRDDKYRILLLTFYHNFGDFVYVHTSIGRDEYKLLLYTCLADITTQKGPVYFLIFKNAESVRVVETIGAKEVSLTFVEQHITDFAKRIGDLTNRPFYKNGDYMFDHLDEPAVVNPLYLTTRNSFLSTLLND